MTMIDIRSDSGDPFALGVTVATDVTGDTIPCSTNDGCGSTCPSACNSNV
jgi:FxLD family lantipeptide